MIGEQDVEPEEDAEGDVQIERDQLLHPGAQHLYDHLAAVETRAVHLPQTGGGHRRAVELLERGVHRDAELLLNHADDVLREVGRHLILQPPYREEIRLGEDVRAGGEQLRELDEGGAERGHRGSQPVRAALVVLA